MERYYDAHLYFANWGTRILMLRLPTALLDAETALRYCFSDWAEVHTKDDYWAGSHDLQGHVRGS